MGEQDFVGFDYYWGTRSLMPKRIQQLLGAASGHFETAPVWSGVLYEMLKFHAKLFPNQEILIIENGCVDTADGMTRGAYLREHIREVQRAYQEGINVVGYICWCITSNREWGLPFNKSSDFGLYHIDLDHDPELKRIETEDTTIYRNIVKQRAVN
jgi:beta-glucosidase/6-phospho-beta-glucosidase/beta-galactosidase